MGTTRERLIQRLKWYYPLEKGHAFVTFPFFILLVFYLYPSQEVIFITYGLLVCTFILYQGQKYWGIKLKKLRNQPIEQEKNLLFFEKCKKINRIIIFLIPVVFIFQFLILEWKIKPDRLFFLGIVANIFATLEHINYYHTQLMVDNRYDFEYLLRNKKFKTASLANDLRRKRF